VFLLALGVRTIYLGEYASSELFRTPIVDSYAYHTRAQAWAATGRLEDEFFWQPPFYPLFLAVLHRATGASLLAARIAGVLVGSTTCALTHRLGVAAAGPRVGLIAGTIVALYGPSIALDAEILGTAWEGLWSVSLLLAWSALARAPLRRGPLALATGVAGGLAVLTRPTFLPFLLVAALWLALRLRSQRVPLPATAGLLVALGCGFLAVTMPVAVAAGRITGRASFLPASAGINLWIGNNPDRERTLAIRPGSDWEELTHLPRAAGITLKRDTSRYFQKRVLEYARSRPLHLLLGLGEKGVQLASSREIPRNFDVYLLRDSSRLLGALLWKAGGFGFPFGVLLPLALAGFVLHRPRLGLIAAFCASYGAAIVLVFVSGRYRAPLVPALAVAGGAGLVALTELVRSRAWPRLAAALAAAGALGLVTVLPGPFAQERTNYRAEMEYLLGRQAVNRREPDAALAHLGRAVALDPGHADAHTALGTLLHDLGRDDEAVVHFERAIAADADQPLALANLARVLAERGDTVGAEEKLRLAVEADPYDPKLLVDWATALAWSGRHAEALEVFRRAHEMGGDDPALLHRWGRLLATLGSETEARERLEAAIALDPLHVEAIDDLALLLLRAGRRDAAVGVYRRAERDALAAGRPDLAARWSDRARSWSDDSGP
jgi:Flp pilus assembly protein TadD/4-amino-4-deoxy-L-arabinose transferase-like glycosyltransferase